VNGHVVFGGRLGHEVRVGKLDLEGQGVDAARELADAVRVVEVGDDLVADDRTRRAVGRRVEDDEVDAERRDGLAHHPAQLSAADDAERRSR